MRKRKCNNCEQWSRSDDWGFGCPSCGHTNGRGDVSYSEYPGVEVMPDIKPYQSMINGQIIGSRSTHRTHLRDNNCQEIGNELKTILTPHKMPDVDPSGRNELIVAQIQAFGGHDKFMAAKKREIDNIRWNSRKS